MPEAARNTVFISYRRTDAEPWAILIREKLQTALGDRAKIYLDHSAIMPGKAFRTEIENAIQQSKVMIVVMGETWINATNDPGSWWRPWRKATRRLEDPTDFVRKEIATALQTDPLIIVIPTRVGGARRPVQSELPEDIRGMMDHPPANDLLCSWFALARCRPLVGCPTHAYVHVPFRRRPGFRHDGLLPRHLRLLSRCVQHLWQQQFSACTAGSCCRYAADARSRS